MPSTAKPRKSNSRSASSAARPARSRSRSSSNGNSRSNGSSRSTRSKSQSVVAAVDDGLKEGIGQRLGSVAKKARNGGGTIAAGATAATVGTAVAAIAGRALIHSRSRRKRVLGVPMPRNVHMPHRHKSGVKGVAKQVADVAGQLEKKSADVSKASSRAKQAAQILS